MQAHDDERQNNSIVHHVAKKAELNQIFIARKIYFDYLLLQKLNPYVTPQMSHIPAPGLINLRNDCYINSINQLLNGMRCTREFFLLGSFFLEKTDLSNKMNFLTFARKGGLITTSLHCLFHQMFCRNFFHQQVTSRELS